MNHIYEGTLNKNGQEGPLPFRVRTLNSDHLPAILNVQEEVLLQLQGKDTLQPLTKEEFEFILTGKGLMIGAFDEEKLIAFRALLVPPIDEEHLGIDIGLPEEELSRVIYQEISNVLPAYRGNQLQKILATLIMQELAKSNHGYRYVCCTVAPFNMPSLKDKFAQGMEIGALKEKYGGSLRYVFMKDLKESEPQEFGEITSILMSDTAAQQAKLTEGWRGVTMEEREGTMWVVFGR
ncbi:GNAT family N-acetyltransferase [Bacillus sp. FJAT-29790]|uniref:GNAT family N-acetyltransferase n=1 Tax=Bacillus sp. FJAT-29790 TaxID=1895002 RepID=UPI001C21FC31|nr:GNAT family N-acetyltransferase [Bacillus sp. FJAT-29790]